MTNKLQITNSNKTFLKRAWNFEIVYWIFFVLCCLLFGISFSGCKLSDRDLLAPPEEIKTQLPVKIAKWYNNHKGAISLNYDHGFPQLEHGKSVQNLIIQYGLKMDYDLVTYEVMQDSILIQQIKNFMIPNDFGFFGHGDKHDNHDTLSYDECLVSFKNCYNKMLELGIKPAAYAYPGGLGYHLATRKALKDAGFLCGRKFEQLDFSNPYIVPDSVLEPKDWYALPTLIMQSVEYDGCVVCVNDAQELLTYLKETISKTAWIIITYHHIGRRDQYGFYDLPEFEKDLQAIKSQDLWCAKTADVVLYIYERKSAKASAELIRNSNGVPMEIKLKLSDNLPNDFYSQPLTLQLEVPEEWIKRELILSGNCLEELVRTEDKLVNISIPPDESYYHLKLK